MGLSKKILVNNSASVDTKPTLLVIDDDPFFCAQVRYFVGENYHVCESLGAASVASDDLLKAQIIVLDLNMPGIDGIEFIKTLAALNPRPQLLITSGYEKRIIDLARQTAELSGLSHTAVLQKPVNRADFMGKLDALAANCSNAGSKVSSQTLIRGTEEQVLKGMLAGEFLAHYQPQIDIATNRVSGIEALARWDNAELGLIPPSGFIPVVELSSMAMDFTLLIVETAMRDYMTLHEATGYIGKLSVNVPPDVFANENFVHHIIEVSKKYNFPLESLVCEITEHGVERMGPETISTLTRLKMNNVQLSVDDFGIGQSGLSKIKYGVFDELKIDRSFVADIKSSKDSFIIVESIMHLATQVGMRVVAEGVEDDETLACLSRLKCPIVQGYYFSMPLPISQFIDWYRKTYPAAVQVDAKSE